mmetsp:Transcript_9937/g.21852  ORF Transcript_9937/g.21852 Transcript_9937/m.21852 type:complete len:205 (+) Transcript_9937:975-1589(+)
MRVCQRLCDDDLDGASHLLRPVELNIAHLLGDGAQIFGGNLVEQRSNLPRKLLLTSLHSLRSAGGRRRIRHPSPWTRCWRARDLDMRPRSALRPKARRSRAPSQRFPRLTRFSQDLLRRVSADSQSLHCRVHPGDQGLALKKSMNGPHLPLHDIVGGRPAALTLANGPLRAGGDHGGDFGLGVALVFVGCDVLGCQDESQSAQN